MPGMPADRNAQQPPRNSDDVRAEPSRADEYGVPVRSGSSRVHIELSGEYATIIDPVVMPLRCDGFSQHERDIGVGTHIR